LKVKQIEIMKLIVLLAFVLLLVPSLVHASNGEIYSFSTSPSQLMVFKNVTINVGVSNPSEAEKGYKLKVSVVKEGKQAYGKNFYFDLNPSEDMNFLFSFIPKEIDEYEVVLNLYDKYEIETYDTRIEKFEILSETGPFDLSLESLSRIAKPGEKVPIMLEIKNMGEEGTDVNVSIEMGCFNQSNNVKEFLYF